ncbi:MAG: DUF6266 family protein [Bacteroidales bacterium]|nr:DUF6266 family protein [Bacteroidales bacterium]
MARIKKGILGGISGKVGNVVGGNWKGVDYLRSLPTEVRNANTVLQMSQRAKFRVLIKFLQPMKQLIRIGFKPAAGRITAFNAATSYNYHHALAGDHEAGFEIAFSEARLALGELESIIGLTAESTETAKLNLGWTDNSAAAGAASTDILYVAVYNPLKNHAVVRINAAERIDASAIIELPANYSGDTVHVYTGFITAEVLVGTASRDSVGESVYAGAIVIA